MKKVLILILAVVLSFSVFAMTACQTPCETHVDVNHDGICDVCATEGLTYEHADANHDGACDVCGLTGMTVTHTDSAHDGKCDVCNANVEVNHVDADNNGYCDVCNAKYDWVDELAAAKAYIDGLYLNAGEATTDSFTVTTVVAIGGVSYSVAWEIKSDVAGQTAAVLGEVGANKQQQVVVDGFSAAEVAYKLVGTISDSEGHSVTVEYGRKVPKFVVATWEEYVAACEASDAEAIISVRGYVTAVNADSGSSSKGSVWVRDAEGHGYYAYKPALDDSITASRESILAAFPVGAEVVISGTVANKYGNQHNAGCTVKLTGNTAPDGWNAVVDLTEAFSSAETAQDASLDAYYGSMATLKNVTMGQIDGYNYHFTINGKDYICYMNIYLMDEDASAATAAKWVVGGKANLTGLVTTYSKNYQIYPYGPECIEVIKEDLSDAQVVERVKGALALDFDSITAAGESELPTAVTGYDATITWALDATYDFASITDGKLVVTALPTEQTTIKLVATISKGEATDTAEFEILVASPTPYVVSVATAVEKAATDKASEYIVVAKVKSIDTEYSSQHGNISVTIEDETGTIYCYRLKGGEDLAVGDLIVVRGKLGEHNGNSQFAQGATYIEIAKAADVATVGTVKTIAQVAELATTDTTNTYIVAGTISKIDSAYSSEYKNISFTITDGTDTFYCYRVSGGEELALGDLVIIIGKLGTYKDAPQFAQGATYLPKPVVEETPSKHFTTIESALTGVAGDTAEFSGTVTEITEEWSSYNNMSFYVSDGTNKILVFRSTTQVGIGDVVSVSGTIGIYNSVAQIAQGSTVTITTAAHACESVCVICGGCLDSACTEEACETKCACVIVNANDLTAGDITANQVVVENVVTILATESAKVTVDGNNKSIDGFDFTQRIKLGGTIASDARAIKLDLAGPSKIIVYAMSSSSSADRNLILQDSTGATVGTQVALGASIAKLEYSVTAAGTYLLGSEKSGINIYGIIITAVAAEESGTKETLAIAASTGALVDKEITWTQGVVTVKNAQAKSTSAIRTSDTDHFRAYAKSQLTISISAGTLKSVVVTCTSSDYATALVNALTTASITAVADGKVVTITVTEGTSISVDLAAQVRFNSVEVVYEPAAAAE